MEKIVVSLEWSHVGKEISRAEARLWCPGYMGIYDSICNFCNIGGDFGLSGDS